MIPKFNTKTGEFGEYCPPNECHWFQIAALIASAVIAAYSAAKQGQAQKAAFDYQAAIDKQRAERERLEAANREADFNRTQSGLEAKRRAFMGLSGVDESQGSPLMTSEDFHSEVKLAGLRIREGGEVRATRLEQGAALGIFQGKSAQSAGYLRAGSLLVSGAGKAYGKSV